MTTKEAKKKLRDNWVKPGGGWKERERAERILCPEGEFLLPSERDFRIAVIIDYLKI